MTTTQQPFTAEVAIEGVPATPLVGEELLNRIAELEVAGVEPKDVLIRCGYYVEGGDYGKANIDFFDAKLKAQKANGSWKPWTPPSAGDAEEEVKANSEDECGWDLSGKRVCITGKLTSPRHEVEGWLSDVGATVVSGVSKTTDALIVGEKAGSKLDKAKELGIKILTEEEAHALLGEVNDGITEAWTKRIIERLLSDLPDADVPGYFKLTDAVESKVVDAANKEELSFWLSEQIGLESTAQRYIEFSDVKKLKVTWLELDQEDYVTVWYYDNECGSIDSLTEVSFNNHQDALSFVEEKNSGWGGHLSTIKVCEQKGDTFKMIVGDELKELNYPYWEQDLDMVLGNLDYYSEVAELLSDESEDPRKELHEIMRKGLWPKTN